MNPLGRLAQLADRVRGRGDSADDPRVSNDGGLQTNLYACRTCSLTYISEDMEVCPSCGGPVDSTPTERDLGLV